MDIQIKLSEFRGDHYHYGFAQGEDLTHTPYMDNRSFEWVKRRPKFQLDYNETKNLYSHFAPHIWEELMGLQDSLKITDQDVLLNLAHYRISPKNSGCSVYLDDHHFIRNYDYHPNTYDGMYKLFQPDHGYAHIGPASRVTGRMDGMNEHGLVVAYNFMNRKAPFDGFTCFIISRFILELCKTADEARQLLKELPHRGGFSYIIQDQNNHSFIAEASSRNVVFRNDHICTNHYLEMVEENRRYVKESQERLDIVSQIQSPSKSELLNLFTDKDSGLYVDNYKSWSGTIHTSYYDKAQLTTDIRIGNGSFNHFDFAAWLRGEPLETDHINSTIDTDIKFTNADWQRKSLRS
jgi:predicted choloylglycine hydrolase